MSSPRTLVSFRGIEERLRCWTQDGLGQDWGAQSLNIGKTCVWGVHFISGNKGILFGCGAGPSKRELAVGLVGTLQTLVEAMWPGTRWMYCVLVITCWNYVLWKAQKLGLPYQTRVRGAQRRDRH